MRGLGKAVVNPAGVSRGLAAEVYRRHAATLYGQALLILGDEGMAERVARDVIVEECARRGSVRAGSPGVVHSREREALSLVLFGGLEYREASRELAIPASAAAALLRAALISLADLAGIP
jgi:hypothetical protein